MVGCLNCRRSQSQVRSLTSGARFTLASASGMRSKSCGVASKGATTLTLTPMLSNNRLTSVTSSRHRKPSLVGPSRLTDGTWSDDGAGRASPGFGAEPDNRPRTN